MSPSNTETTAGSRLVTVTVVAVIAAIVGVALFGGDDPDTDSRTAASGFAYQVGDPGVGEPAPDVEAMATTGAFDLTALEGQRVLLYFQEGLMCQPCWDQLTAIESRWDDFDNRGIDTIASITTDAIGPLDQKVAIEGITSPVVADPDHAISERWDTLDYGMMGGSHNGHTFVVVGPDGTIEWRADYGGAPDYTMFLPVEALLADLDQRQDPA